MLNNPESRDISMFALTWKTSERKFKVHVDKNVSIRMSDGIQLDADIFRPSSEGRFPALVSAHPYSKVGQTEPVKVNSTSGVVPHPGEERTRGSLEAGDPYFFARHGYAQVVVNLRGTGLSEGFFELLGKREVTDVCEVIDWTAKQSWCDGNIGMFGVSYFAMIQYMVAARNPPHLKCIFAPWGTTDLYRDMFYHGGTLAWRWLLGWADTSFVYGNVRPMSWTEKEWGKEKRDAAAQSLSKQADIEAIPELVNVLRNPDEKFNPYKVDVLLNQFDSAYWEERRASLKDVKVPAYLGADWGIYRSHLPAAFRNWENIASQKRMIIGPPAYLDRPLYQLQYESLRWFDRWLKGVENGVENEPPIRLFVMGTGEWKEAEEWPLPQTRWTPFYLHEYGLLSEREHWPNEGSDSFFDSPWSRGYLEYLSPQLVEDTEVIGPIVANIYASTTGDEILWNLRLFEQTLEEKRKILTGGWLKGSHRALDKVRSKPWQPFHSHDIAEPLEPNTPYEFNIAIVPTGNLFRAGTRIGLRISCSDYDSASSLASIGSGHLLQQYPTRITVYHNEDQPSHLLLPITAGNILGTYISGGKPYV